MQRLLDTAARAVRRRPGAVLIVLAIATLGLAGAATQLQTEVSVEEFAPVGTEISDALRRVQQDLGGAQAGVTVIVDAGEDGDVLTGPGMRAASAITDAVQRDPTARHYLAEDNPIVPAVVSYATPVLRGIEAEGFTLDDLDDAILEQIIDAAYTDDEVLAQVEALLSPGLDGTDQPRSRGGLVSVSLRHDLDEAQRMDASLAVQDVIGQVDLPRFEVVVFSDEILQDELQRAMLDEVPLLLGLSLAVIVIVLGAVFQRVSDVLIALMAMVVSLTWLFGAMALLGPRMLGITGGFTQVAVAVPVMLIGLGVDYSLHLTGRYREELQAGTSVEDAVSIPPRTVGRALVLVTVTTMIGFLANIVSPLPPIVDFSIFMAVGMGGTLVVFILAVPSARFMIDRRRSIDRHDGDVPISGRPGLVATLMSRAADLSAKAPIPVLAATLGLAAAGAFAGFQLDTEFNQEQFIPEDTDAAFTLALMDELFGAEVGERSHLVIDADLEDPAVLNAMLAVGDQLVGTEHVAPGAEAVTSPAHLIRRLADAGTGPGPGEVDPELVETAAELEAAGWADDRVAPDADVGRMLTIVEQLAPDLLAGLVTEDRSASVLSIQTRAGEEHLDALIADVDEAVGPLQDAADGVTFTNIPLVIEETLDALVGAQTQKIALSTMVALVVLVAYFGFAHSHLGLGAITLVPTVVAVPLVLGAMWIVGLSFNALTATVAAIAIGFGVDYGIHLSNRFIEERERSDDVAEALCETVTHSGTALFASALTTAGAFTVLVVFGELEPVRQFGAVTAMIIVLALVATLFSQCSALALWDRHLRRQEGR